jgi:hypothetical protein
MVLYRRSEIAVSLFDVILLPRPAISDAEKLSTNLPEGWLPGNAFLRHL